VAAAIVLLLDPRWIRIAGLSTIGFSAPPPGATGDGCPGRARFDAASGYDLDAWADESYFALELSSVRDVGVDEDRRSAIVVTGPERSATLNVSRSRWSNAFSKKNVVARDDALRTIRRALSGQFSV